MNELAPLDAYGDLIEPATLKIERLLPGPVERVWDYLTKSDLRRPFCPGNVGHCRSGHVRRPNQPQSPSPRAKA